jgi:indolepyruvate ferredoxin oxidoreductase beta subunit
MTDAKPIRLLIAALGGEGGGVLSSWIHQAAIASGHFVQGTFIPGVAQRTGATTYYLEIVPRPAEDQAPFARPVLALNAAPGEVDIMVASELLEATRAIHGGYVTPDRTLLVASTHRVFSVDEKSAMADGRVDETRMREASKQFSRQAVLADFAAAAGRAKSPLNAVLLGALAATGALPIPRDAFRATIKAEGKAVEANLRGFEAGLKLGEASRPAAAPAPRLSGLALAAFDLEARARALLPPETSKIAVEGVRRLVDFQGPAYAALYLERLGRFACKTGADALMRELARHLAVRMSFEDTIRVAQLKLKAGRIERLREEANVRDGDLIEVIEFLKPGPEEIFSLLPPRLGRSVLGFIARRGWSDRAVAMRVRTTRLGGFLRLKLLAALKPWRPRTLRYADEQAWIERWLGLIERALAFDVEAAREVVETAGLVKGYGETMKRGHTNWRRIADEIIEPFLDGRLPGNRFSDALMQSRIAALADPDGDRLASVIDSVHALPPERRAAAE